MTLGLYWPYATRSLVRGGQRTLLAIFCVAVGAMAVVALQLVGNAVNAGLTTNLRALNGGDVAVSSNTPPFSSTQLTYFDQLQAQDAITAYTAADRQAAQIHIGTSLRRLEVWAIDPARFPLVGAPVFTSPSTASLPSVVHGKTVVITTALAQVFNLQVGDAFHFSARDGRSADATVGGIIQSVGFFQGSKMLIALDAYSAIPSTTDLPLTYGGHEGRGALLALPSAPGLSITYNEIYADVPGHTDANAASAERQIRSKFPLASIQTTEQALAGNQTQVQQIRYFLQIVGLLALLIGGVGIANTMQVALRRRRTEIAMLKTAGYRRRDLYALFGLEAGLLGLFGGVVGAAAGVGISFLVKGLMETAFQIMLPTTVDALTIGSGVAVGFCTALIFGLMPIVQAAQVRPQAVLRELPEGTGWQSAALSLALAVLLAALFFVLTLSILRNILVALLAVGGTGILLVLLGFFFGLVAFVISKLPVLDSFRWWYVLLVGGALLVTAALTFVVPAFGVLCLAVALMGIVVVLLPRTWKSNVKLALRNIGRQRARTVTTLLALYIGVFAVGLVLVLGQNLKASFNQFIANTSTLNALVLASGADKTAVDEQLAQAAGVERKVVNTASQDIPTAINSTPIAQVVQAATATGRYTVADVTGSIRGTEGYDLASGQTPDPRDFALAKGSHDAHIGRNLDASDAGTTNALVPVVATQAPLNLELGDTITIASPLTNQSLTLTIVGFYQAVNLGVEPIQVDNSVVITISGGKQFYAFSLRLDPQTADATLAKIQDAVPGVQTFSLGDILDQVTGLLNNLITLLVAVASLAMLASVIIIANAVALAMLERRRELGILKAVGHTSRSVLSEVLFENAVVGFTGAFLAMLLVTLATTVLGKVVFNLSFGIPAPIVLGVVLATAAVCMVVAASVAWGATRVRPLEVLRYE